MSDPVHHVQQIRPGVGAVIQDESNRVLLHHRRVGRGWAPPSGAVEPGETVLDALHREVHEETELTVTVQRLVGLYSSPDFQIIAYPSGHRAHFVTAVFLCNLQAGTLHGSNEADRWEWFPPDQLPGEQLTYATHWLADALAEHRTSSPPVAIS